MNEWFDAELVGKTDGEVINLLTAFTNAALLVIASAAFGRRTAWTSSSSDSESVSYHSMNFLVALKTTIGSLLFKVLIPTHVYTLSQKIYIPWLTSALNNTTNAFESLRKHMLEIVSDARALGTTGSRESAVYPAWQGTTGYKVKSGLLANLVEANTAYGEGVFIGEKRRTLTEEELLSDTFVRSKTFSAESSIKQFIFRFSYLQDMVRSGYLDRLHLFKYPQQRLQPTLCVLPRYFSRSTQISKPRSCEK